MFFIIFKKIKLTSVANFKSTSGVGLLVVVLVRDCWRIISYADKNVILSLLVTSLNVIALFDSSEADWETSGDDTVYQLV